MWRKQDILGKIFVLGTKEESAFGLTPDVLKSKKGHGTLLQCNIWLSLLPFFIYC